jgi:ADP-ribosylation factor 2-binding protein
MSESKIAESKDDFDMTVNDGDDEEEIICEAAGGSAEDDEFDRIVGCLEEVMMDPAFSSTQTSFCLAHCSKFDRSEENKLEYTLIFEDYTKLMESIITTKLSEMIDGFSMQRFEEMLVHRQGIDALY